MSTVAGGMRRRGRAALAIGLVLALVASLTAMVQPPGGASGLSQPARLRPVPAQKPVPVSLVPSHKVKVPVMPSWHRPAVTWPTPSSADAVANPAAGSATPSSGAVHASAQAAGTKPDSAAMADPSAGSARAGALPVWIGPAVAGRGAAGRPAAADGAQVRVTMASRRAAAAAGVSGVIFTVARTPGPPGAAGSPGAAASAGAGAAVHVSLDYSSFAYADGGDYAARLHLVELPACALTTPRVPACRRQQPLSSADDVTDFRLGADVALPQAAAAPAGAGAGTAVVAATTSASGSAGDYSATPLSEAGTWAEGGSSGAFTYSYPISAPPVPGGLAPQVSLAYDSQAVDGLTSSTNNQASWIGDGWDYQPGYIERDYQSCEQTSAKTGDLCWSANDTVTLVTGSQDTTLIDDPSTGWHAEADNGEKITYKTGTSNGTNDGGYWVISDPDGTSYYFGLSQLPGYASGDAQTNSAWTVPVYATASGQPCYNATFSSSHCEQAWRWNLDYVTDSHGDAMAMFYNTETNYYAADNGTKATASYTQAGALSKIEYGLRAGSVYGVTPAAEINFTTATDRTDIPTGSSADLACSSGASCDVESPTFWSKYRLTTIATETLKGSSLEPVDSWAFAQDYPAVGSGQTPPMWLQSITRTAKDGTAVTLPPVTFAGISLANRVETAADLQDGYSIINRFRLSSITDETGGVTTVSYDTPPSSCTSGNFPAEDADTTLCYDDYWTPPGSGAPVPDWFNEYVVTAVTLANTVGGTTPVVTSYTYSGAAWHYDDDSLTRSKQRTWDEWRGFRTVTTQTGTAPDPVTESTDTYFQGMNGDYQSGGGTSSASLTSAEGSDTVTDSDQFAGQDFEHVVSDGAGGAVVSDTVTMPWASAVTATQSQPSPLPALQAFMTGTAQTQVFTPLAQGGARESQTTYTHDSYGRVTSQSAIPDTADPAEDTCATTSYAANTSTWLLDLPAETTVVSVPCGSAVSLPADGVSDTRTYYDGSATLGAAPSAGNTTMTQLATSYSGATPSFTTESKTGYDEYGRVTSSADADNRTTTTSYTPATGAEPASKTVTDPMGLATTTTYDPARDLPLTVTNPAGWVTAETYDALGRLTAVWTPGHAQGSVPADQTFSYSVSSTAPSVITTKTITASGGYNPSETLYDSLGRAVETQAETPDGGRDITDTFYNSDNLKDLVSNSYYTTGAPSGTLVAAPDDEVPSQTGYVYDGAGRLTQQISYKFATETWETDTSYGGDYTTVVPPAGGTSETTFTNGEGHNSAIYQYHSGVPASPSDPASDYDATTYLYTPAQQLALITDPAGNQWNYSYDLSGNQVSATDPDAGTSTSTYDAAGQMMSATDARGKTVSYTYDQDGRKTAEYDTTGGAADAGADELASWTYDTLAKGQSTSSTSYVGGTGGSAYTEAVTGYDSFGLPAGEQTTIPASAGPLAGTYTQSEFYDPYGDLQSSYQDAAAGGLPAEQVSIGYNSSGEPVSLTSPDWDYVAGLSYTELGQPQQYAFGTTTEPATLLDSYDQETGRLTSAQVQTGASPVTVDATSYSYDDAGNITSSADTPASGPAQVQCFGYDYLGRLTQAWSQGTTGCSSGPSQSAQAGAAAPYWEKYAYNAENDLTSQISTPVSGGATTTTDGYPAAGSARPHALTSQQVAGPSGTSTTSYGYNADGDTTSATSSASTQNLNWNDAGQLASVTTTGTNAGSTAYTYDAGGNLLLQSDPGTLTLYLPDEQLVENTATKAVTGTRYYAIGGVTVAARTSAGQVDYLTGNQQGTDTLAINSATLAVTRRYYDPYGNPAGAPPSSWPGTKGFVGGTADSATGLTNLGAREYDPVTGAFISPDPLINPYNPEDLNAYAYAQDNPSTNEDPSGQMLPGGAQCGSRSDPCNSGGGGGHHSNSGHYGGPGFDTAEYPIGEAWVPIAAHCSYACGPPPVRVIPPTVHVAVVHQVSLNGLASYWGCDAPTDFRYGACSREGSDVVKDLSHSHISGWQMLIMVGSMIIPGGEVADVGEVGAVADAAEATDAAAEGASAGDAADAAEAGCGQSFTPSTGVLLASGKTVPISQLQPGDKVLATNTKTGKTQAEPVAAVLVNHDTDLFDLTVLVGGRTVVIHTTSSHLFWDATTHRWARAVALGHGDHLRVAGGSAALVLGGQAPADIAGFMWDLTVTGDHDFYVSAADASVLVHNCPAWEKPTPKWKKVVGNLFMLAHTLITHPTVGKDPELMGTVTRIPYSVYKDVETPDLPGLDWGPPDDPYWTPPEP